MAPAALHAALEDIPGSPPAVPTAKSKPGVVSFSCSSCSSDEAPELFEASAPGPGGRRVQRMGSHAVISSEQLSASLDEEAASSASSSATATPVVGPSTGNSPATTADPAQLAEALVAAGAAPARSSRLAAAPAAGWEERPEAALEAARRSEKAAPFV